MTDYPRYTAYRYDADPTLVAVDLPSAAVSPPAVPPTVPPGGYAPAVVASLPAGVVAAGWLLFADGSYVPRYAAGVSPPPPPPPPAFAPRLAYSDARNSQYLVFPGLVGGGTPGVAPAYAPRLNYSDARNSQYLLCPVLLG